jgi:hypothetical protein
MLKCKYKLKKLNTIKTSRFLSAGSHIAGTRRQDESTIQLAIWENAGKPDPLSIEVLTQRIFKNVTTFNASLKIKIEIKIHFVWSNKNFAFYHCIFEKFRIVDDFHLVHHVPVKNIGHYWWNVPKKRFHILEKLNTKYF